MQKWSEFKVLNDEIVSKNNAKWNSNMDNEYEMGMQHAIVNFEIILKLGKS